MLTFTFERDDNNVKKRPIKIENHTIRIETPSVWTTYLSNQPHINHDFYYLVWHVASIIVINNDEWRLDKEMVNKIKTIPLHKL